MYIISLSMDHKNSTMSNVTTMHDMANQLKAGSLYRLLKPLDGYPIRSINLRKEYQPGTIVLFLEISGYYPTVLLFLIKDEQVRFIFDSNMPRTDGPYWSSVI